MINRYQSLNMFWKTNFMVLGLLLALAPISCLVDDQLFILINREAGYPRLDNIILFASNYGFAIQLLFITMPLACWYTLCNKGRNNIKEGIMLLLILSFAFLAFYCIYNETMEMVKETAHRPRPYLELEARVIRPLSYVYDYQSFPSGHAGSSFFLFSVTVYFLNKSNECMKLPKPFILIVIIFSSGLALSRAIARIYLGYHYPSDIVCGAILGLMFAIAGVTCIEWLAKKLKKMSG